MKYIVIQVDRPVARKIPFIFPNDQVHSIVADAILKTADIMGWIHPRVVSAGECKLDCNSVSGFSETLGLKSDPEDEQLIDGIDYFHGIL